MRARFLTYLEDLRANYWLVPTVMAVLAALFSFVTLAIDEAVQVEFLLRLGFVWSGGPDGARGLLSTVAGSMITVAGVTFSITVVALSLASSQFGPRLLRNFMRDRGNQVVLGTFIATFVYSLLILRTIRNTDQTQFVPFLSTTIALILALASIAVLIFFIHHTALSIQAPVVVADVANELLQQINHIFPQELGHGEARDDAPEPTLPDTPARVIKTTHSGYLAAMDDDKLLRVATINNLCLKLWVRPGDFLSMGTRLAEVYGSTPVRDDIAEAFQDSFVTGKQRTQTQNIEFLIDQLVEVAVRALSPGINDPFTAMNCIDWLGAALSRMAERRFPAAARYDKDNNLRIIVTRPETFPGITNAALNQIREYSVSMVAVRIRLLEMLTEVVRHTFNEADRLPLQQQAEMISGESNAAKLQARDFEDIQAQYVNFLCALQAQRAEIANQK